MSNFSPCSFNAKNSIVLFSGQQFSKPKQLRDIMKKLFIYQLLTLLFFTIIPSLGHTLEKSPTNAIRVGIFPFSPFNYFDSSGTAQGLNPDLLREIAKNEKWELVFVQVNWADALEKLQNQEIDMMVSVAYSPQRAKTIDYTYESVAELWGQVFLQPESGTKNINDLNDKRVGVMRKDISGKNFIETAAKMNIHCQIFEFASHEDVFKAVQEKVVDAGIAPQHFGLRHSKEYNLVGSTILFSPFSIYFATKKGTHHEILSHIDAYLSTWKKDKNSYYYQRVNYWLGGANTISSLPTWFIYSALASATLIIFFAGFILLLKRAVRHRTKELTQSEALLLEAQDIAKIGRWELDFKNNLLIWSEGIYSLFEVPRETFTPSYQSFFELIHPEDRTLVRQVFKDSLQNKTSYVIEHRLLMADGRTKWVNEIGRTEYDRDGTALRSVGTVQDITARKEVEIQLLLSKARYQSLLHTAMDGFWLVDQQGNLLEVNETYCAMSGYNAQELLNMSIADIDTIEDAETTINRIKNIIALGDDRFISQHRRKDDTYYDVEVSTQYRPTEADVIVVFIRDITEIRRAEEEKRTLTNQLLQSQKMEAIGTLAGGIAHDFNNILSVILGYAELALEDSPLGSAVAEEIAQVIHASNRAKTLVQQILDFSRQTEADKIPLQPGIAIKETLKFLRSSLPATISIEQHIDMDCGFILADPTQIHQLLMNLCSNAFQAMEKTGGLLSVSVKRIALSSLDIVNTTDVQPGNFIQISITDSGPGIALAIQDQIFDPYFTTKEVGKGTGMGLAIVHGIVSSYGGFVNCKSKMGEGTTFQINIPVAEKATLPETESVEITSTGNERILFVDDEEMLAEVGKRLLELYGYNVTIQTSSLDALALFKEQPTAFDLVITDQTMPKMTGFEMAQKILNIREDIPIIICTGYSSLISEEQAISVGIKALAHKPMTKDNMALLVRRVLDQEYIQGTKDIL